MFCFLFHVSNKEGKDGVADVGIPVPEASMAFHNDIQRGDCDVFHTMPRYVLGIRKPTTETEILSHTWHEMSNKHFYTNSSLTCGST